MFLFGSKKFLGLLEKNSPSVTSTTNFPLNFSSAARSSSTERGELPSMASCTASSPVNFRQVGISRSYFIRDEPIKTVALSGGVNTLALLSLHSCAPSSKAIYTPLLRKYNSQPAINTPTANRVNRPAFKNWLDDIQLVLYDSLQSYELTKENYQALKVRKSFNKIELSFKININ